MKKHLLSVVLISFVLLNFGCKKALTEPTETLTLTIEDVSCTEAWLKITSSNFQIPNTLTLFVNDKADQNITLVNSDTVLYIDSLLPNQSYKIKATFATNNQQQITNEVVATTMDTTSYNFTWQTFTFGEHSSSTLYDVAIINENNIWAVGEIYMNDSLGNSDPHAYNAVHWDGNTWELKRIMFYTICGQTSLTAYPAKSIYAFSENDIWIAMDGDQVARINGTSQISTQCLPWSFSINKLWGTSSSDLYAVGNSGNIAHYDGKNWQKIESGTTLNINDIWGDFNKRTQEWEILAVCGNILQGWEQDRAILEIKNGTQAIQLNGEGASWPLSGVWFKATTKHYVVGSGIYYKLRLTDSVWNSQLTSITTYHTNKIRGNDVNDVIIVGAYGEVLHFNGMSWQSYLNETGLNNGTYLAVDIKNDFLITVGYQSAKAIITIGKR